MWSRATNASVGGGSSTIAGPDDSHGLYGALPMSSEVSVGGSGSVGHADLVLLLIPLVFGVVYGAGMVTVGDWWVSTAGAALACWGLIGDGLFWHSPV